MGPSIEAGYKLGVYCNNPGENGSRLDQLDTSGNFQKWLDTGFVFKVQPTIFAAKVFVGCERKRKVKDDSKIWGLSNQKNEVKSIPSHLTGLWKNRRTAVLEISLETQF